MIRLNRQEVLANGELRALDGISIRLIHGKDSLTVVILVQFDSILFPAGWDIK